MELVKSSGAGANVRRIGVRFGSNSYPRDFRVGQASDQDRQRSGQTESCYLDLGADDLLPLPFDSQDYASLAAPRRPHRTALNEKLNLRDKRQVRLLFSLIHGVNFLTIGLPFDEIDDISWTRLERRSPFPLCGLSLESPELRNRFRSADLQHLFPIPCEG